MGKRDLITKDFALYVVHYFNSMQTWSKEDILGEIDRTIKDAKAEDAVRVVRCKDCKYAMDMMPIENSGGYMMGECTLRKEDDIVFTAWGDDFCSYGERKDDA